MPGPHVLADYIAMVPHQHRNKPKYIAWLSALLQPFVDRQALMASVPALFDIDSPTCAGVWQDMVGEWVGASRDLSIPLTGVYFAWDTDGVGWDQGTWYQVGDSTTELTVLPDDAYMTLIRARIAANHWDGTIPGAYLIWATLFGPNQILIQDNQDMSMTIIWLGQTDAVTLALLTGGYLDLRPAGVQIRGYFKPSVPDEPIFGWDADSDLIKGWDEGAWLVEIQ